MAADKFNTQTCRVMLHSNHLCQPLQISIMPRGRRNQMKKPRALRFRTEFVMVSNGLDRCRRAEGIPLVQWTIVGLQVVSMLTRLVKDPSLTSRRPPSSTHKVPTCRHQPTATRVKQTQWQEGATRTSSPQARASTWPPVTCPTPVVLEVLLSTTRT